MTAQEPGARAPRTAHATPTVRMLGTRGVPAAHGGFETAADHISRYLVGRGWRVVVYCQVQGSGPVTRDTWEGVERMNIPVEDTEWRGTIVFVSHDTEFVEQLKPTKVLLMPDGQVDYFNEDWLELVSLA